MPRPIDELQISLQEMARRKLTKDGKLKLRHGNGAVHLILEGEGRTQFDYGQRSITGMSAWQAAHNARLRLEDPVFCLALATGADR